MKTKISRGSLVLFAGVFLGPLPALADPPFRDVVFEVPLNLTELPAIISKVAVDCEVKLSQVYPTNNQYSQLIRTGTTELNVVGGTVSQTAQVLVTLPSIVRKDDPSSIPTSSYKCTLRAFLEEGLGWDGFGLRRMPARSASPRPRSWTSHSRTATAVGSTTDRSSGRPALRAV